MPDHKIVFPFAVKTAGDSGTFEGLLSTYGGTPDRGNDLILPGAFVKVETTSDGQIRILDSHDTHAAIGKGTLTDTSAGLVIKGRLNLAVARAREVLALMKDGIISGLSIGYSILENGSEIRADGVRLLKRLHLFEASLVAFPMNPAAMVSSVKGIDQCKTVGEWESVLRSLGASKRKAHAMAIANWKIYQGPEPEVDPAELTELFNSISQEG
jgi:hypothetical protein